MNISVIIPVYNAKQYLKKAVASALQFTIVKEVVLVEDGCPNGSLAVCKDLLNKDVRVKLYQHPGGVNKGAGASRNLGIEKATQDYIAFLDADDVFLDNRFTKDKQVFLNNPEVDGVYNAIGVKFYSEKAKKQFVQSFNVNEDNVDEFLTTVNETVKPTAENCFDGLIGLVTNYGYFSLDGLTLKRSRLKLKFNPALKIHQDTDFLIKLAYYLKLLPSEINHAVALRGVHEENRITANNTSFEKEYKRFLLWDSLYTWASKQQIPFKQFSYIKKRRDYYYLTGAEKKSTFIFFKTMLSNRVLLKSSSYADLHELYFGKKFFSKVIYKFRNWSFC